MLNTSFYGLALVLVFKYKHLTAAVRRGSLLAIWKANFPFFLFLRKETYFFVSAFELQINVCLAINFK